MAKLKGTPSGDTIDGSAGSDQIDGAVGNDVVYGHGYNDTIEGNQGDDTLHGGAGNDSLNGGSSDDLILGGAGDDTLLGGEWADRSADRVAFQWSDVPDPHNGGQIDDGDRITTGSQSVKGVDVSYDVPPRIGRLEKETQYTNGIDAGDRTVDNHSAVDISNSGSVNV